MKRWIISTLTFVAMFLLTIFAVSFIDNAEIRNVASLLLGFISYMAAVRVYYYF